MNFGLTFLFLMVYNSIVFVIFFRFFIQFTDEIVMFINAGGEALDEADFSMKFLGDSYFEGGNVMQTNEDITEAGDCPFIYRSVRFGRFWYRFNNLPPGDYFVDLHFAEIINTNGPKGMRVFNVYMQEEKASYKSKSFQYVL